MKVCRVISSDREPDDLELDDKTDFFVHDWIMSFDYGAMSELITHDVVEGVTRIAPFRSTNSDLAHTAGRSRDRRPQGSQKLYEWRSEDNTPYLVSLEQIEPFVEGCWATRPDGLRQPIQNVGSLLQEQGLEIFETPKFPYH